MTNQQGAPEAPKGTAADGKTELFNVPGYPLMVRAVDFNRLHAENERLAALVEAQQPAPSIPDTEAFQNFHRLLCARFGYVHDERDWRRDQLSLVEHIARQAKPSPTPQADSAHVAAPADTVVLDAALRAIHQAIDLIGEPNTERLRTVRRVLRGAVVVAEDGTAPQADSQPAPVLDYPPLPTRGYTDPDTRVTEQVTPMTFTANEMRAYVDADRAARAPADRVTAPAGGVVAGPILAAARCQLSNMRAQRKSLEGFLALGNEVSRAARLDEEIKLLADALDATQTADSVLEDAARYRWIRESERADSLIKSDCRGVFLPQRQALDAAIDTALFTTPAQRGEVAGDGNPCNNDHDPDCRWPDCICRHREVRFDAARKQGANHD